MTVNTIYFWDNETEILAGLKRLLHPGGNLIITLRPKRQMMNYPFTRYGFKMFSKEEVMNLLTINGFTVTEVHENLEPDLLMNGEVVKMENLVVVAVK